MRRSDGSLSGLESLVPHFMKIRLIIVRRSKDRTMRRALFTLTAVSGFVISSSASAYDEKRARSNFSHEMVICAAYYSIAAEGVRRTGNKKTSEIIQKVSDALLERAREYSIDETVLSRFRIALEDQANLIHRDYDNVSVVVGRNSRRRIPTNGFSRRAHRLPLPSLHLPSRLANTTPVRRTI
jgi:hypothetical protein